MSTLPNTNLSQLRVACTVGETAVKDGQRYLDTRLSKLCTSSRVNQFSRFRPGYWTYSGNQLAFVAPDGTSTDPRGTRPDGGTKQGFHLGDFRGYNPTAYAPFVENSNRRATIPSSSTQHTEEIYLQMGEVDWLGKETVYHGTNYIPASKRAYIIAYNKDVGTTSAAIVGYASTTDSSQWDNLAETDGYNKRVHITATLSMGSYNTRTFNIGFAFGSSATKIDYLIPNAEFTCQVSKLNETNYTIAVDGQGGLTSFRSAVANYLTQYNLNNINGIYIEPNYGAVTVGVSTIPVRSDDFYFMASGAGDTRYFRVTATKVNFAYTVEVIKQSTGTTLGTFTGTAYATNTFGALSVNIPINFAADSNVAQNDRHYRILITTFNNAALQCAEKTN